MLPFASCSTVSGAARRSDESRLAELKRLAEEEAAYAKVMKGAGDPYATLADSPASLTRQHWKHAGKAGVDGAAEVHRPARCQCVLC